MYCPSKSAMARRVLCCLSAVVLGLVWLGPAIAQESSRGPLFSPGAGEKGAASGGVGGSFGSGSVGGVPRGPAGGPAVSGPMPGVGGAIPSDLLQSRPSASGESPKPVADPLRGLILKPEQLRGSPAATGERGGSGADWAHQADREGSRAPSRSSGAPADPMGGLLQDSDSLLKFSGSKGDGGGADVTARPGDDAAGARQNRGGTATQGIGLPDLLTAGSGTVSMPGMSLPTTSLPTASMNAPNLGIDPPASGGNDTKSNSTYRPASPNYGSRAVEDQPVRPVSQKFSLVERLWQSTEGALQQPLTYVLLLGLIGYVAVAKLRRR